MCGILGIVAPVGRPVDIEPPQLLAMRDTMTPRGPDDAGLFTHRNVAFAHRRLAIRDLGGGQQPWLSDDQQCVLVYNGELYNDAELKRELVALGHRFRSHCDTEVVMEAYRAWGPGCVRRLRGMFAFGIYDFRDDSLFLARDHFGIKPLFLAQIGDELVFASSIPAILRHPRFQKAPNLPAISHYLTTYRITLGRDTVFAGLSQLLPGESLRLRDGRVQIESYWDYPTDEDSTLTYDDAVNLLHDGLREAVASQLVSDVPVGMFMSGGVDSNTIACLVHQASPLRMIGQCGGGDGDRSGDFEHARQCAEHVGFDFREVRVSPGEYLDTWRWMVGEYATPLSTASDVIIYHLARRMKQDVGVVLTGEGADEALCGYGIQHWSGYDFEHAQRLASGQGPADAAHERELRRSLHALYDRDQFGSEVDHFFALNSLVSVATKPLLLQPWAWDELQHDRLMIDYYASVLRRLGDLPTPRKYKILLHRINLEGLLGRVDSATMLGSLEARVPFTDHVLVERMFRVPHAFKIAVADDPESRFLTSGELDSRGLLQSKRILRSVAQRLMPGDLAQRRKASFPTPVQTWLTGEWADWVRRTLATNPVGRELFQSAALTQLADNLPQSGMRLWPILNVMLWGERVFYGGDSFNP